MKKSIATFSFWLPTVYLIIILINLFGFDDKNLLLFFTSPLFWIAETHWFVVNFTHPANIPIVLIMIVSLAGWFFAGFIVDFLVKKLKILFKK
jgi:hypothetical protein